ncbi:MAG TPA: Mpo1-like protein [Polyangiales bacterium]
MTFMEELREQRWDDHRYYHHNRINQSLHLISSLTFVAVYVLLFTSPVIGVLLGWIFAMLIRQVGHFFFEPKSYDHHNNASHDEKESLKVGYNLHRKVILLSIFGLLPLVLYFQPSFFGLFEAHTSKEEFVQHLSYMWLVLGVGAVVFRGVHLFFLQSVQTGIVWMTKIVTDPFHDIMLYWRAPFQALRGEMYAPQGPQRH